VKRFYILYDSPFAPLTDALSTDPVVEADTEEEAAEIMEKRYETARESA
jgi:hypothetical protein